MRARRSHRLDRLARIHDAEILPLWSERFGRLLLAGARFPPGAMILDAAAGTGQVALEALPLLGERGRVVAIDPVPALIDVARAKAGPLAGRRIFLRSDPAQARLPFADEAFDAALGNLALDGLLLDGGPAGSGAHGAAEGAIGGERDAPDDDGDLGRRVGELARVTRAGGFVRVALPLRGTFGELHALLAEAMGAFGRRAAKERLERHVEAQPTAGTLRAALEGAGLVDVTVTEEPYQLEFASSRAFFFAPLIEQGPLAAWRAIAGEGEPMQQLFWRVRDAIDDLTDLTDLRGGGPFRVTVRAACAAGRRPAEGEAVARPVAVRRPPPRLRGTGSGGAIRLEIGDFDPVEATHDSFSVAPAARLAPAAGLTLAPGLAPVVDDIDDHDHDDDDDGGAAAIFVGGAATHQPVAARPGATRG